MPCKLLFVVNDPDFFLSHRLPLALAAREGGFDVHVASMGGDGVGRILELGFIHHVLLLSRSGKNPFAELRSLWGLLRLFWQVRPTVVHLVTIKPVIYGGIAARLAGVPGVVSAVSGLGFVFIQSGLKAALVRQVVAVLYRLALGKANLRVIFQNSDDQERVSQLAGLSAGKAVLIRGAGVDLGEYAYLPELAGEPVVVMATRLLKDKGVFEFVEAARRLKLAGLKVRFCLAGTVDPGNPASCAEADLQAWRDEGVVELLGHRFDIAQLFANSHVVVLPSYREGLPKVLIEAAACGRAVVTTDVPGCRDAMTPNKTGLLVPVHDAAALADAIERLVLDADLRQRMGRAGRALAEQAFDVNAVVEKHLQIYRELERGIL